MDRGQRGLEISYTVFDICHWQSLALRVCFAAFPRLSGKLDIRAGIQDCFMSCSCSGIITFGSWPSQPAWNQIGIWTSLFQFSQTLVSFPFLPGPRAFLLISVCPVFLREFTQKFPLQTILCKLYLFPSPYWLMLFYPIGASSVVCLMLWWQAIWCVKDPVYYFFMTICILIRRILEI